MEGSYNSQAFRKDKNCKILIDNDEKLTFTHGACLITIKYDICKNKTHEDGIKAMSKVAEIIRDNYIRKMIKENM